MNISTPHLQLEPTRSAIERAASFTILERNSELETTPLDEHHFMPWRWDAGFMVSLATQEVISIPNQVRLDYDELDQP